MAISFFSFWLQLLTLALIYMGAWFIVALSLKRNDVADFAWGLGFVFLGWVGFAKAGYSGQLSLLVNSLVTIWGIRLSYHVYKRNIKKAEDPRYTEWRQKWGRWQILGSFLQVFMLQGLLLMFIATSAAAINFSGHQNMGPPEIIGLLIWLTGFAFEVIGDGQLKKFISNPLNKGKILMSGLWQYTRHPNYFGEVTMWCGIWLMAFGTGHFFPSIISPLTITWLILFVSGVPLLEKKYRGNADFEAYKKHTSIFFPLPPKE